MSVFELTHENAPTTFQLREALPLQNFIFNYDGKSPSTVMHITRSALKYSAKALFVVVGLVEKATRFAFTKLQEGIDRLFTREQQAAFKGKVEDKAREAKGLFSDFIQRNFGQLIG